jgi:pSer/pThr/pTyr-binding forkhead associated (FHA) protein
MMELEVAGQRTPIPAGELVIGSDPSCGLRLDGLAAAHAVVIGIGDGSVALRRVGENEVLLNGVKLGAEPAPVLHGDKMQLGRHEVFLHDPRRSGSTQFVKADDVARMVAATAKPGAAKMPTAATGGRLVCLTDGREYTIGGAPLVFGREAGSDIVVPNKDVSRRHAEIFSSPQGYVLVDSSTNGTFVNGDRIEAQRVLARADVIRIGDHEFRFYADRMPENASLAPAPAFQPPPPPPPSTPALGASERLNHTMHGMPVSNPNLSIPPSVVNPPAPVPPVPAPAVAQAPKPAPRPGGSSAPLSTFLVRSGLLKGQRLTVRVPVVNIGRAEYNDLVIPDDSVSGSHAKLQRREGIWVLTDNQSTNGTWVDGERVYGEVMLGPGAVVRFGEISAMFEPTDDHLGTGAGSGTKIMGAMKPMAPPPAHPVAPPPIEPALPPMVPTPSTARPAMGAPIGPAMGPSVVDSAQQPSMPLRPSQAMQPPRRQPVVIASPPSSGMPRWLIPLAIVIILGVAAAILLTR